MKSVNLATINTYDLVILVTDHDKYDYNMLQDNAKLIVDTRGKLDHKLENVISA